MQDIRSILFVCLGNICRSPMAEGAFRAALAAAGKDGEIAADSAGTGRWHVGEAPNPQAIAAARAQGVDISGQRCRQIAVEDFARFDLILGMDRSNMANLAALAPARSAARVALLLEEAHGSAADVADPWGHDDAVFADCYRQISGACAVLASRFSR